MPSSRVADRGEALGTINISLPVQHHKRALEVLNAVTHV
jgi:hypothetical protein